MSQALVIYKFLLWYHSTSKNKSQSPTFCNPTNLSTLWTSCSATSRSSHTRIFFDTLTFFPLVETSHFGIFPPLEPYQPILTSFPPMSFLPWDLKSDQMSFLDVHCGSGYFFTVFLKICSGDKMQQDHTDHYSSCYSQSSSILTKPLPYELHCPTLSQQSPILCDIQIACLSHALDWPHSTHPQLSLSACFPVSPS